MFRDCQNAIPYAFAHQRLVFYQVDYSIDDLTATSSELRLGRADALGNPPLAFIITNHSNELQRH